MNTPNIRDRILSREESETIIQRIRGFTSTEGTTRIRLTSWWNGELRWARNRVQMTSDRRHIAVSIARDFSWGSGGASTNQLDDVSLQSTILAAERTAQSTRQGRFQDIPVQPPDLQVPVVQVWSDTTAAVTATQRAEVAQLLTTKAAAKAMLSAGYLEMRAGAVATSGDPRDVFSGQVFQAKQARTGFAYQAFTQAQCSVTVRHPAGAGSGWAGLSSFDWSRIDGPALANRALEKCLASINPFRIEPGRYTVVLEPQAVCDLLDMLVGAFNRAKAERGEGPFVLSYDDGERLWRSKLGLKIVDERITLSHDPSDPDIGIVPVAGQTPITWIEHGILKTLEYEREAYALPWLNDGVGAFGLNAYRMSGGSTSKEDMIASTKRGLLVTRFSGMRPLEQTSYLCTGVTRDGLWLIENGVITKAVKNMRITESPLFVLNQVDMLGPPVPVFRPSLNPQGFESMSSGIGSELTPAIVPPLKANDFSFTALSDAI